MSDEQGVEQSAAAPGTTRRRFVQAAAAAGVVGATWTAPVIRGSVAGAQTGASVNGSCTGAVIAWSGGGMDDWQAGNATTFVGNGAVPDGVYTWDPAANMSPCPNLTAPVEVTATGDPALTPGGATVSITSGVSCMFANIVLGGMFSGSIVDVTDTSFMYVNEVDGAMSTITFDILC